LPVKCNSDFVCYWQAVHQRVQEQVMFCHHAWEEERERKKGKREERKEGEEKGQELGFERRTRGVTLLSGVPGTERVVAGAAVKSVLRVYDENCARTASLPCVGLRKKLKASYEDNVLLEKFLLEGYEDPPPDQPIMMVEPLLDALRSERYVFIKELSVWDVPLKHENVASVALLLEKLVYPVRQLELLDCGIESYPVTRLARSFPGHPALSTIILDYNEIGDAGCRGLCAGLSKNVLIQTVSLNFCGLEVESGRILAEMVTSSAVCNLFLDGNDLECEGAMELIKMVADTAEREAFERAEEIRMKAELEAEKELEASKNGRVRTAMSAGSSKSGGEEDGEEKGGGAARPRRARKARRRRKDTASKCKVARARWHESRKKKKKEAEPPKVGPWLKKLHLAENGLDAFGKAGNYAPVICMRLFRKLITNSNCLEELDLGENHIGDLGGRELLQALLDRKEAKLPTLSLGVSPMMHQETFALLMKHSGNTLAWVLSCFMVNLNVKFNPRATSQPQFMGGNQLEKVGDLDKDTANFLQSRTRLWYREALRREEQEDTTDVQAFDNHKKTLYRHYRGKEDRKTLPSTFRDQIQVGTHLRRAKRVKHTDAALLRRKNVVLQSACEVRIYGTVLTLTRVAAPSKLRQQTKEKNPPTPSPRQRPRKHSSVDFRLLHSTVSPRKPDTSHSKENGDCLRLIFSQTKTKAASSKDGDDHYHDHIYPYGEYDDGS
ncbi:hypothetical protein Bbelb_077600, partial [Branchiostoma belcheri]